MLVTKRQPFRGVENYFTNSVLYRDSLEADPQPEEPDYGDNADIESESDDEYTWELDYSIMAQIN